jgi:hypothetical protein
VLRILVVGCLLAGCASAEDASAGGGGADFAVDAAAGADDFAMPDDLAMRAGDGGVLANGCPAAQHVVVNEVQVGSAASANDEFIELYNPCGRDVDLTGSSLVYRAAAGTSDVVVIGLTKTIRAGGWLVVAGPNYTGSFDQQYGGGKLAGAGGGIGIRDAAQLLVDSLGYGTATNAFIEGAVAAAPANGQSIARIPNGVDTDHNNLDFATVTPTPGAIN